MHIAAKPLTSTYNQHNNSRLYSKGEAPTLRQAYSYNKDNSTLDKSWPVNLTLSLINKHEPFANKA